MNFFKARTTRHSRHLSLIAVLRSGGRIVAKSVKMQPTGSCENEDLKKERRYCSFDRSEITHLIDGSPKKTQQRRQLELQILQDPEVKDPIPTEYLSHADRYAAEVKKACLLTTKLRKFIAEQRESSPEEKSFDERAILGPSVLPAILKDGHPFGLHFAMFMPALLGHGTPEQQAKWLTRAFNLEIIGTYAQTEMGHGTFLRGLETTATYNPKTQEFLLETPSISAYKWWPGGLGQTANYAVVMALLYTHDGKCHGPHPFLIQLRDEGTHEPLPGIVVGEIGPKLGLNSVNNGYLAFNKVRVPRDQMLMKNAQVLEDGTYVKPKSSKLSYATMVLVRVMIVEDMTMQLRKAVTIATRYSCVRHQSELEPGAPEPQIIEYVTQQNKLFPPLAATFAFQFASDQLWAMYGDANKSIKKGDLQLLPDLHGLSCALKALSSSEASNYVETLRQSCGGHGFMTCSNFPRIYALCTASETYEGENTVLWLQVARYLVKTCTDKSGGQSVAYLIDPRKVDSASCSSLEGIVNAFGKATSGLVTEAIKELENGKDRGEAFHNAWNNSSVSLIRAAQAHARYWVADCFVRAIKERALSPPVRKILSQLCELFIIHWLLEHSGDFVLFVGYTKKEMTILRERYNTLLAAIRPEALNLVDAFDIRDEVLNSALGCWDGNVYQRLFDEASKSPLNKTATHQESFQKYLKPMMKSNM